jgi:hypothetical protein
MPGLRRTGIHPTRLTAISWVWPLLFYPAGIGAAGILPKFRPKILPPAAANRSKIIPLRWVDVSLCVKGRVEEMSVYS